MELIRDVLDKQLLDRRKTKFGKVDGLVVQWDHGHQPEVVAMAIGGHVLARRVGHWAERLYVWCAAVIKAGPSAGEKSIPWSKVRDLGVDIEVDIDAQQEL